MSSFLPEQVNNHHVCCLVNYPGSRNEIKPHNNSPSPLHVSSLHGQFQREGWQHDSPGQLVLVERSCSVDSGADAVRRYKHIQSSSPPVSTSTQSCPAPPWSWSSTRRSSTTGRRLAGRNSKFSSPVVRQSYHDI